MEQMASQETKIWTRGQKHLWRKFYEWSSSSLWVVLPICYVSVDHFWGCLKSDRGSRKLVSKMLLKSMTHCGEKDCRVVTKAQVAAEASVGKLGKESQWERDVRTSMSVLMSGFFWINLKLRRHSWKSYLATLCCWERENWARWMCGLSLPSQAGMQIPAILGNQPVSQMMT